MVLGRLFNPATGVLFEWNGAELSCNDGVVFGFDNVTFRRVGSSNEADTFTWLSPTLIPRAGDLQHGVLVQNGHFIAGCMRSAMCYVQKGQTLLSHSPCESSDWEISGDVPEAVVAGFVALHLNAGRTERTSGDVIPLCGLTADEVLDTFHLADLVYNDTEDSEFASSHSSESVYFTDWTSVKTSPLVEAVQSKDLGRVLAVLPACAHIDVQDDEGWTAVHHAAKDDAPGMVDALLLAGAKADTKDKNGLAPLHVAAMHGHDTAIRTLVRRGALASVTDNFGTTPCDYAATKNHPKAVQTLKAFGCVA